eukprot:5928027-Pyramimonas_sp.AAC.2
MRTLEGCAPARRFPARNPHFQPQRSINIPSRPNDVSTLSTVSAKPAYGWYINTGGRRRNKMGNLGFKGF